MTGSRGEVGGALGGWVVGRWLRVQDAIDGEVAAVRRVCKVFACVVDGEWVVPFYGRVAGLEVAVEEVGGLVVIGDERGDEVGEGDFFGGFGAEEDGLSGVDELGLHGGGGGGEGAK